MPKMEDPPNSVVRGGHNIDMGRRGPWWSGGRMEHHCGEARSEVRANKIMQTAWWCSPSSSTLNTGPSKQHHADGLVVVGAQQSQGGGVLFPAFNHKEEVWEEFTTRQGEAKGRWRRRIKVKY